MKKICILLLLVITCILVGCSKDSEDSVVKNMKNKIKDIDSYYFRILASFGSCGERCV